MKDYAICTLLCAALLSYEILAQQSTTKIKFLALRITVGVSCVEHEH